MKCRRLAGAKPMAALLAAAVAGPAAGALPAEIVGEPIRRVFDGRSDDLLSAGLGAEGLRGPAPGFADPANPTALELRRRAIWNNYRGLADISAAGGFGRLSGPRDGERIAGVEYLVAVRKPGGAGITTVMLQIPATFDAANPCLVAAASSGSRGVYGALPTAGEWGLRKGCAVVHTDKGTGMGFHDLDSGTAYRIDLMPTTDANDPLVIWRAAESAALAQWRDQHPHRVAIKHAHSRDNPERNWGQYLLQAIKVGFMLLQKEFPATATRPAITRERTTVIASGVSNGGGTVLRAVEADTEGLLDGAVVSEPNPPVAEGRGFRIAMGARPSTVGPPPPLFDYALLHYLLQPAAVLAPERESAMTAVPDAQKPVWEAWTTRLAELGLVSGDTLAERARDARRQLEAVGVLREALDGGIANVSFGVWPAVGEAYLPAYARLGPEESPCGLSYAAIDAQFRARALTTDEFARFAADAATGVPPVAGLQLVDGAGRFASLGSIEHALCLREIATGRTLAGEALSGERAALSTRLRAGIEEIRVNARLRGLPVIVVHGRRDALIPVNFSSRAWYALHRAQGERSARYYEVEHGHHYDAFNALPGWGERHVPLQPQLLAAMDLMHGHLAEGRRLPPSQVVRSRPRAVIDGQLEPIAAGHLGAIRAKPGADEIRFRRGALIIPE
jgi:hydroxybutyrate-dimer hydrolase